MTDNGDWDTRVTLAVGLALLDGPDGGGFDETGALRVTDEEWASAGMLLEKMKELGYREGR